MDTPAAPEVPSMVADDEPSSAPPAPAPAQGVEATDHAAQPDDNNELQDAPTPGADAPTPGVASTTGGDEAGGTETKSEEGAAADPESEAETLIESPVKKREAERRAALEAAAAAVEGGDVKMEDVPELPAPNGGGGTPGSEADAPASPVESVEMGDAGSVVTAQAENRKDGGSRELDGEDSESLSEVSSAESSSSSGSDSGSEADDSQSRTQSEPRERKSASPNTRKRKHRASSAGLPNKRQSLQQAQRKLRGLYSEGTQLDSERAASPRLRNHRRAVSTQSALHDEANNINNRKRRAATHNPAHPETKHPKHGHAWEESDASSETSRYNGANSEIKRSARHIGRSTSTPGRPVGGAREHKRHVNKYGLTRLAEACESGDLDLVKEWRQRDPEQLELAEFAGNTPLQIAALNGNAEVVEYLISEGCNFDTANVDKDTPLIDAAENGHIDTVQLLIKAGVDPLRQNQKGQQALDVVNEGTDESGEVRATLRAAVERWNSTGARLKREREEEEERHRLGPSKEVYFMARTYENLLKLVTINDRSGVQEFLDARVPVDNGAIAAAARTGDSYLVNMLLAELPEKKAHQKAEKPMLGVLGTSHFEMVKVIAGLDQFKPLYTDRQGRTWPQIAEEKAGPNAKAEVELLQGLYDEAKKTRDGNRGSSSSPVSQRHNVGQRRQAPKEKQQDEESDDDDEPAKPKHGPRRLMSRRDMRAAAGKPMEDSESEEGEVSDGDLPDAPAQDTTMKPPDSPNSTRKRTKSLSMQAPESPRQTRRRSSSLRGPADGALPSLEEKAEPSEPQSRPTATAESEKHANNASAAKFELEQVLRLEQDRQASEAANAAAAKLEAERERAATEAKQAEAAEKQRRESEAAEKRKQAEANVARRLERRQALLAALPGGVRFALDPESEFAVKEGEDAGRDFLRAFVMPLQVVRGRDLFEGAEDGGTADLWTLNICAAGLLGKEAGLELLLGSIDDGTMADRQDAQMEDQGDRPAPKKWTTRPLPNPSEFYDRLWPALQHQKAFLRDNLTYDDLYAAANSEDPYHTEDEAGETQNQRRLAAMAKRIKADTRRWDKERKDCLHGERKVRALFGLPERAAAAAALAGIRENEAKEAGEAGADAEMVDAPSDETDEPATATTNNPKDAAKLPLKLEFVRLDEVLASLAAGLERRDVKVRAGCYPLKRQDTPSAGQDSVAAVQAAWEQHPLTGTEWGFSNPVAATRAVRVSGGGAAKKVRK